MIDYDGFRDRQQSSLPGGRSPHRASASASTSSRRAPWGLYATEPAHIRVQPDGSVDVYVGLGVARPGYRDDDRPARVRAPRRRLRQRHRAPG